ncbi:MAG: hypothetical protein JWP00_4629 [Chloroflexi bacterium]|jgi:hypothetical protein|nr:hypothetical protein [Chloroflexota bacterium]
MAVKIESFPSPQVTETGPLVSLIILTYDRQVYLKEALTSAVNQSYRNLEIAFSFTGVPGELVKQKKSISKRNKALSVSQVRQQGVCKSARAG